MSSATNDFEWFTTATGASNFSWSAAGGAGAVSLIQDVDSTVVFFHDSIDVSPASGLAPSDTVLIDIQDLTDNDFFDISFDLP